MDKELFKSILQGMKEALAHARGEITLPGRYVHVLEAEQDQHAPPKRKVEGSNPSGDSNSDNL